MGKLCWRRKGKRLTSAQKWVLALGLLVLALGLANLARMGGALYYATHLPGLPMTVSWAYLATLSGFWGLAFVACAVGLWRFRPWGRWATLVAVPFYEAHAWLNHFLCDASDYARQTRPRDLALTLLLLAVAWGLLSLPGIRKVFGTRGHGEGERGREGDMVTEGHSDRSIPSRSLLPWRRFRPRPDAAPRSAPPRA